MSYADAGVNIDAGNAFVDAIKSIAAKTKRPEVITGIGGFGSLFALPQNYREPVLVSATDGVGTKLKLAFALSQHDTIGIDLVAMCVNDLITLGAEPLFFLDYFATGRLSIDVAKEVVRGIGRGCELSGASLVGGETAEMPGMYQGNDYDLAGFCVGIVEKSKIIDGSQVRAGDALIGLGSTGPHSNGYSLIRKILDVSNTPLSMRFEGQTLGETLLSPTRIYVKQCQRLLAELPVKALAHITGGGLLENIPRVLPQHTKAVIKSKSWDRPSVFDWIQATGNIEATEMYRTFNCGIGMVACVAEEDADSALQLLHQMGEPAWKIGTIKDSKSETPSVTIK